MTLDELRTLLTALLDDDGVYRTDSQLNDALNDAYKVVALLTQACEVTKSFSVGADTRFAILPDDFFLPIGVYFNDTRLYPVRLSDLDMLSSSWLNANTSTPVYYFTTGSLSAYPLVWLHPATSAAGRIRVTYASMPDALSNDSDIPRIPLEHHQLLTTYAFAMELLKEFSPLLVNKAFQTLLAAVDHVNLLRNYIYRRTPDRDWELPPWDIEALRLRLHDFEVALQQQQQREPTDLQL